jgi:hypothetical protein
MKHSPLAWITIAAPALALVACGSSGSTVGSAPSPQASIAAAACVSPPPATGPDVAGTLGNTESGGTYCLSVGEKVSVFLSVPLAEADTSRWTPISASDTSVLQGVPSGALTLVRGVTAGIFAAGHAGTCRLSSTRPTGQTWEAVIVVQ